MKSIARRMRTVVELGSAEQVYRYPSHKRTLLTSMPHPISQRDSGAGMRSRE